MVIDLFHSFICRPMLYTVRQRPVRPSFERPIFSLGVEKYHQIPPNSIVGGPQTPSWPNKE